MVWVGMGLMLGLLLAMVSPARACFGQTTPSADAGPASDVDRERLFRETCPDLVLYQRNERDGAERYTYEFSNTVNGNRHPFGSTVTVRCKENGLDARVFVYDKSSTYIADSPAITATCDPVTRNFVLRSRVLDQVYCGRNPPIRDNTFQG